MTATAAPTSLNAVSETGHSARSAPLPRATGAPRRRPRAERPDAPTLSLRARQEQRAEQERSARTLAAVIALACVEAEAGRRPLRDLATWLDLPVYDKVARRLALLERTGASVRLTTSPRPLGARVHRLSPDRLEACATITCDERARAIAMRLERRLSRWKVTQIEIG